MVSNYFDEQVFFIKFTKYYEVAIYNIFHKITNIYTWCLNQVHYSQTGQTVHIEWSVSLTTHIAILRYTPQTPNHQGPVLWVVYPKPKPRKEQFSFIWSLLDKGEAMATHSDPIPLSCFVLFQAQFSKGWEEFKKKTTIFVSNAIRS